MQIPLNLKKYISYDIKDFILHSGNSSPFNQIKSITKDNNQFALFLLLGKRRVGKSFFSLAIEDALNLLNIKTILCNYSPSCNYSFLDTVLDNYDFVIIDDLPLFFEYNTISEGEFVSLIEKAKRLQKKLLLTSHINLEQIHPSPHISSRLKMGVVITLNFPEERDEAISLFKIIAKQRGIKLSPYQIKVLVNKLPRDLNSYEKEVEKIINLSLILDRKATLRL